MNKRTNGSDVMGTQAEHSFINCMRSHGHKLNKSTREQDMHEHWDYLVDDAHKVEVKGRKRAKRSDDKPNDTIIYIEFANVNGDPGWIYGKADYIAFERPDGFLMVPRCELAKLAEILIGDKWAKRPTLYQRYRRNDRPDECVGVIRVTDLRNIPHKMVSYK